VTAAAAGAAAEGGQAVYAAGQSEDLAYARGLDGTPAPAWVKSNPAYYQAWQRGLRERGGPMPFGGPPRRRPSRKKRPARTRPVRRSSSSARPGYVRRAFSPKAAANRIGATKVARAGDGGGLLLALVLYPLLLATIQHGAAGPKLWFEAKWLNKGDDPAGTGGPRRHSIGDPNSPRPVPGKRYWRIDPKTGHYQIVDSNGRRVPGIPEFPTPPAGVTQYPSAGGAPS
jgi:hypothetical protein